ncbi:MAG: hypothetical protein ACFFDT_11560 [Candidatus Hodarchaeota archaeon]
MKHYKNKKLPIKSLVYHSSKHSEKIPSFTQLSNYYDLMMLLTSYNALKRQVLIILAHIYPVEVSASELAALCSYSKKSNMLYRRKPLETLEKDSMIILERVNPKLFRIQLNVANPVMDLLSQLCQTFGLPYYDLLISNLERKRNKMIH